MNVRKNIPESTICEDDHSVVNTVHPQYSTVQHTTRDYLGSRGRFKRIMKMLFSNTNNYFMVMVNGKCLMSYVMSHAIILLIAICIL